MSDDMIDYEEVAKQNAITADKWKREAERLEKELKVTDELLDSRQIVINAIPECKSHGSCLPHAIEWIEEAKGFELKFYQKLEKKLEKIVNAEMDVVDYYYKISEKVERLLDKQ